MARLARRAFLSTVVVAGIGMWPPAGAAAAAEPSPGRGGASGVVESGAGSAPDIERDPSTVPADRRDELLPAGWQGSDDLMWTTAGDSTGFHLLVAESSTGYTWRTVASLSEPGLEADRWIGNVCLTGSGRRAVVVYAPRHFTNRQQTFDRGGFVAVVDLTDGAVRKLAIRTSLAYYNPGCGVDEVAVLTQSGVVDLGRTRLHVLDTVHASVVRRHELPGQVTSAVPAGTGVVAAAAGGLVEVTADGGRRQVAKTRGTPFDIHPDRLGGVAFLERHGDAGVVRYLPSLRSTARELARGPLTEVGLAAGRDGQVFITGAPTGVGKDLPGSVRRVPAAVTAEVSTLGVAAVSHGDPAKATPPARPMEPVLARPVRLTARVLSSGRELTFEVLPGSRRADGHEQDRSAGPATGATDPRPSAKAAGAASAASPTDPVDANRTCAVPRNDARTQVEQPHWRQVEWAADLAVRGALTFQRPANWKQSGLPAWSPQGMFALPALAGHPNARVPAAVLLGVLTQESNLWQASWHALEGVTGNPLVSNFYGLDRNSDDWTIRWSEADCGYGVAQVTDGMRLGQRTPTEQRAIAVDYATNIAAGLQILVQKWNQTYHAGIHINDGDPANIENWFAAVWAYNTGMNPQASTGNTSGCTPGPGCTDSRGNWGLGWTNNPANPDYPINRRPFLVDSQDDARNPQWWPYPEKVIGWAASPIVKYDFRTDEFEAGYAQAWWTTDDYRRRAKPPVDMFCDSGPEGNRCDMDNPGNPCMESDFHCWWHEPVAWKPGCVEEIHGVLALTCGFDSWTFEPGDPEPPGGTHYPPVCTSSLPSGALIVDDVPDSVPIVRPNCPGTRNEGTFTLHFGSDASGQYPSKADFHQIGSGLDGHFYFAHTWGRSRTEHEVVGTWTLNRTWTNQWARVLVHLPGHGAHTQQAAYQVDTGAGRPPDARFRTRYVNTASRYVDHNNRGDRWVSLGVFLFDGTPEVSLSNLTRDGSGTLDIAYDAVAFQPLPAKPRHFVTVLGDSYTSGEGADVYYGETDNGQSGNRNACHRSPYAWSRQAILADQPHMLVGIREDTFDPTIDYHMLACSGAQTENLLPYDGTRNAWNQLGQGRFGELSQLEQGYLDENTTLVALSIGGNDLRWADVFVFCANPLADRCPEDVMPGDSLPLKTQIPLNIRSKAIPSIETVLNKIHERAPNATIVLMGYPVLLSNLGFCLGTPYVLSFEEVLFTEQMAHLFAEEMRALIERLDDQYPVVFADPRSDFAGKGVCGIPESIHGIVLDKTPGEDSESPISQQSFHPKQSGALLYRDTFERALRAIGL